MVRLKCYHGTSIEFAEAIVRENRFLPGSKEGLRLGDGAYFFEQIGDSSYAQECARDLEKYHFKKGKHTNGYAIISCTVECKDDEFLNLFDPITIELFHRIRYAVYDRAKKSDPNYQFVDAAHADTMTVKEIKKHRNVSVIRSPEFFGMFAREAGIMMSGRRKYPKTFVPNIILVCADVETAKISNIQIVERGTFDD